MPKNGKSLEPDTDYDIDQLDIEPIEFDSASTPEYVMDQPNELLGNVGSLSSVVHGPKNLEQLTFDAEIAAARWYSKNKSKARVQHAEQSVVVAPPQDWEIQHPFWGRQINEDPRDTHPRRSLWNTDIIESLIFDTLEVQAALVYAARNKFVRNSRMRIRSAIHRFIIPAYRDAEEKNRKNWVDETILVNPEYITQRNDDGTPHESMWVVPDYEWGMIKKSLVSSVNLITDWAASCFALETMFWATCIAPNIIEIKHRQSILNAEPVLGFTMKKHITTGGVITNEGPTSQAGE